MKDSAEEFVNAVNQGNLPPIPSNSNNTSNSGTQTSERGLSNSTFGLQSLNESVNNSGRSGGN